MKLGKRTLKMLAAASYVAVGLIAAESHAGLITEDFTYSTGQLNASDNGGSGWSAGWTDGDTASITTIGINATTNLSYSAGGYAISQTGNGFVNAGNNGDQPRRLNRPVTTPLSGTVWFSFLFNNTSGSSSGYSGISFNTTTQKEDVGVLPFGLGIDATSTTVSNTAVLRINGVTTTATSLGLANGTTHLVVGKIVTGESGSFQAWIDPLDLNNLAVMPTISSTGINFPTITRIGVIANGGSGPAGSQVDAFRISDTASAFGDVTGVPEPSTLMSGIVMAGVMALRRRRRGPMTVK